jgi:hypothetical protein
VLAGRALQPHGHGHARRGSGRVARTQLRVVRRHPANAHGRRGP